MFTFRLSCLAVMVVTSVIHDEVLHVVNDTLPRFRIPSRPKLLVVIFATSIAHLAERVVWGIALFVQVQFASVGTLNGDVPITLVNCICFSAETYTSLGFGDVRPDGHLRLFVGLEAPNGLLLIAWSASYTCLSMERF